MIAYRYNIVPLFVFLFSTLTAYSKLIALEPIELAVYNNPENTLYEYAKAEPVQPTSVARSEYESYSYKQNANKKEEETLATTLELLEDIISTIQKSAEKLSGSTNFDVDQRPLCQKINSKVSTRRLRRVLTALCGNPTPQQKQTPQTAQSEDNHRATEMSERPDDKLILLDRDNTVELIPVDVYEIV
jgi:hypothetical protein